MHRHDDGNVRFDCADDGGDLERRQRRDNLGRRLLGASGPREAMSELRQDVKAQICDSGTHPTSVLSRRGSGDNGMVAIRQRIAISDCLLSAGSIA